MIAFKSLVFAALVAVTLSLHIHQSDHSSGKHSHHVSSSGGGILSSVSSEGTVESEGSGSVISNDGVGGVGNSGSSSVISRGGHSSSSSGGDDAEATNIVKNHLRSKNGVLKHGAEDINGFEQLKQRGLYSIGFLGQGIKGDHRAASIFKYLAKRPKASSVGDVLDVYLTGAFGAGAIIDSWVPGLGKLFSSVALASAKINFCLGHGSSSAQSNRIGTICSDKYGNNWGFKAEQERSVYNTAQDYITAYGIDDGLVKFKTLLTTHAKSDLSKLTGSQKIVAQAIFDLFQNGRFNADYSWSKRDISFVFSKVITVLAALGSSCHKNVGEFIVNDLCDYSSDIGNDTNGLKLFDEKDEIKKALVKSTSHNWQNLIRKFSDEDFRNIIQKQIDSLSASSSQESKISNTNNNDIGDDGSEKQKVINNTDDNKKNEEINAQIDTVADNKKNNNNDAQDNVNKKVEVKKNTDDNDNNKNEESDILDSGDTATIDTTRGNVGTGDSKKQNKGDDKVKKPKRKPLISFRTLLKGIRGDHSASTIFKSLANKRKATNVGDILDVYLTGAFGAGAIIDSWAPGLGKLFSSLAVATVKLNYCTSNGLFKVRSNNLGSICSNEYGRKWGFKAEQERSTYNKAEDYITAYGLDDGLTKFKTLLKTHVKSDLSSLSGSQKIVAQAIYELLQNGRFNNNYSWTKKDVSFVFSRVITVLATLGSSYHKNVGSAIANDLCDYSSDIGNDFNGLYLSSEKDEILKSIVTADSHSWQDLIDVINDDVFKTISQNKNDEDDNDDNDDVEGDTDSDSDSTTQGKGKLGKSSDADNDTGDNDTDKESDSENPKENDKTRYVDDDTNNSNNPKKNDEERATPFDNNKTDSAAEKTNKNTDKNEKGKSPKETQIALSSLTVFSKSLKDGHRASSIFKSLTTKQKPTKVEDILDVYLTGAFGAGAIIDSWVPGLGKIFSSLVVASTKINYCLKDSVFKGFTKKLGSICSNQYGSKWGFKAEQETSTYDNAVDYITAYGLKDGLKKFKRLLKTHTKSDLSGLSGSQKIVAQAIYELLQNGRFNTNYSWTKKDVSFVFSKVITVLAALGNGYQNNVGSTIVDDLCGYSTNIGKYSNGLYLSSQRDKIKKSIVTVDFNSWQNLNILIIVDDDKKISQNKNDEDDNDDNDDVDSDTDSDSDTTTQGKKKSDQSSDADNNTGDNDTDKESDNENSKENDKTRDVGDDTNNNNNSEKDDEESTTTSDNNDTDSAAKKTNKNTDKNEKRKEPKETQIALSSLTVFSKSLKDGHRASPIFKSLTTKQKPTKVEDILDVYLTGAFGAGAIIDSWVPGLGKLFSSLVVASTKINYCLKDSVFKGFTKKLGSICSNQYGSKWGFKVEQETSTYDNAGDYITAYGLKDGLKKFKRLLKTHTKSDLSGLSGSQKIVAQAIYELLQNGRFNTNYSWTKKDVSFVFSKVITVLAALGNGYQNNVGSNIVNDLCGYSTNIGKYSNGLYLSSQRDKIKKSIVTVDFSSWQNLNKLIIVDDDKKISQNKNDEDDNDDNDDVDSDTDSDSDTTTQGKKKSNKSSDADNDTGDNDTDKESDNENSKENDKTRDVGDDTNNNNNSEKDDEESTTTSDKNDTDSAAKKTNKNTDKNEKRKEPKETQIALSSLTVFSKNLKDGHRASPIFKSLTTKQKPTKVEDILDVYLTGAFGAGAIIDSWVPGLGKLFSSLVVASTKINYCLKDSVFKGFTKKLGSICSNQYGSKWGFKVEQETSTYDNAGDYITAYGLKDGLKKFKRLLKTHTKSDLSGLSGSQKIVAQAIYELLQNGRFNTNYSWTKKDVSFVFSKVITVLAALGNGYQNNVGSNIVNDLCGYSTNIGKYSNGLYLSSQRDKIKKSIVTVDFSSWQNLNKLIIVDDDKKISQNKNDEDDNDDNDDVDSDTDSDSDTTTQGKKKSDKYSDADNDTGDNDTDKESDNENSKENDKTRDVGDDTNNNNNSEKDDEESTTTSDNNETDSVAKKANKNTDKNEKGKSPKETQIALSALTVFSKSLKDGHRASSIFKSLTTKQKPTKVEDILDVYLTGAFGAGAIIDSWVPGLGKLFSSLIVASTKINYCLKDSVFNGLSKKLGSICSNQYGSKWGFKAEQETLTYDDASDYITAYGLKDGLKKFKRLLKTHTKSDLSGLTGSQKVVAQAILDLFENGRFSTDYTWSRKDVSFIFSKVITVLAALGSSSNLKLGPLLVDELLNYGSEIDTESYGLRLKDLRHQIKKSIRDSNTYSWKKVIIINSDEEFDSKRGTSFGDNDAKNDNSNDRKKINRNVTKKDKTHKGSAHPQNKSGSNVNNKTKPNTIKDKKRTEPKPSKTDEKDVDAGSFHKREQSQADSAYGRESSYSGSYNNNGSNTEVTKSKRSQNSKHSASRSSESGTSENDGSSTYTKTQSSEGSSNQEAFENEDKTVKDKEGSSITRSSRSYSSNYSSKNSETEYSESYS